MDCKFLSALYVNKSVVASCDFYVKCSLVNSFAFYIMLWTLMRFISDGFCWIVVNYRYV